MSKSVKGSKIWSDTVRLACSHLGVLSTAIGLRNQDLDEIKKTRKVCQKYLMNSEPYLLIRIKQSPNINNGKQLKLVK